MKKKLLSTLLLSAACCGQQLFAQALPNTIPNLQLWLDASDPLNTGTGTTGTLAQWYDKSGQNHHATTYGGQSPGVVVANQINGKSVVHFTRTSQLLGCVYNVAGVDTRATAMPAVTMFTVYKQGTQGGEQAIWGNDNGGWDRFYFTTTAATPNNGAVSLGPQTISTADISNAGLVGTTRLMTAVYDRNTPGGSAIYFDGGLVTPFTDQTHFTDAQPTLRIGFDGDDNCFNGDIAEMLVYNRKLTACEIQQVNRYLGAKYGIVFSTVSITPSGSTTFNLGGHVTLTSSTTGTAYQWLRNGTAISGATSQNYTAYTAGDYRVSVTNNSCPDTSAAVTVATPSMTAPGNALNLDGINDYVDLGNGSAVQPNSLLATNIKSMECWVKFDSFTGDQEILSKSITGNGIELLTYGGYLAFFCMDGTNIGHVDYALSGNMSTGVWYHVACTWNGANKNSMKLYVNGVSVGTYFAPANPATPVADPGAGNTFKIGRWSSTSPSARYLDGSVDEVRVWSAERTALEIQNNMYAPIALPATDLIAYYKFDQGTANAANGASNYAYDYSGNGVQGTLNGMTLSGTSSNWVESYAMVRPIVAAAGNVTATSFTANWTPSATGTVDYYTLDVSTSSNFGTFVSGYNALNVGNVSSYNVTGLTNNTTYYYRVRPVNTSADGIAQPSAFGTVTAGIPLPVELLAFSARKTGNEVSLEWQATADADAAYFGIERSGDGRVFSELQQVPVAGQHYQATDAQPLAGVSYYRLRMVDADGSATYSHTAQVIIAQDASYTVYPSPATTYINVETNGSQNIEPASISDLQGRTLLRFRLAGKATQVPLGELSPGTYLLHLPGAQAMMIKKL